MMNDDFFNAISEITKEKGLEKDVILDAIAKAMVSAFKKKLGPEVELRVEIDEDARKMDVSLEKEIRKRPRQYWQITLEEAQEFFPEAELDYHQKIWVPVDPEEIGRIAAQTVKQIITQKLKELEKNRVFNDYSQKAGKMITGTVRKTERGNIFIDLGNAEGFLPLREQITGQTFRPGDIVKAAVVEVVDTRKSPYVLISRSNNDFLRCVFEYYIPEVSDNVVLIKASAREPGSRSKVSVLCDDPRIDPVGACVGLKGSRIRDIVRELGGERIDIVTYDEEITNYIRNALKPALVTSIEVAINRSIARVVVPDDQLSLAIGKQGQNVRLAARLIGIKIDIISESVYRAHMEEILYRKQTGEESSASTQEAGSNNNQENNKEISPETENC